MPMQPKVDYARVRHHLVAGLTVEQVSRRMGCSKTVVQRVIREMRQEASSGHVR